ncbi:hypothetical protein BC792_12232 [Sphingobacterium allocomposti]|uniref:Uncharacterized protein n=1 Tax=Sphingobacterium allocomposti TaxID=415956 RepID=A0A5S5D5Z4_9SPHI|nr:hypothetical protein BC792_12232 [Sphingobacterium composti Yoo et al. 2007 non Ten et al. 2007]
MTVVAIKNNFTAYRRLLSAISFPQRLYKLTPLQLIAICHQLSAISH